MNFGATALALALAMLAGCSNRPLDLPPIGAGADLATPDLGGTDAQDLAVASSPDLAVVALPDLAQPDLFGVPLCQLVTVSTLAGNGIAGDVDGTGGANGTAELNGPGSLAVDDAGFVYVADQENARIRKIAPDGTTTTFSTVGAIDVALDAHGNLYATLDASIARVTANGAVTIAGNGTNGFVDGTGGAHGTTEFNGASGLAVDSAGYLYVGDRWNYRVRKVAPDGTTTTLAGDGDASVLFTSDVAVDTQGNVYVADDYNHRISKITPGGTISTLAGGNGNGDFGYVDGPGASARFSMPRGVAVDAAGYVYVADTGNARIRRVAPDGTTSTVAGSAWGFADGVGCAAQFAGPTGIALSGKRLLVGDYASMHMRVRELRLP